jgi:hypothetical protein
MHTNKSHIKRINKRIKLLPVLLCVILCANAKAQRVVVNNDSLRVHFRKEKPYKVFDYYDRNHFGLDCKKLYYDEELKFYLLKWLDIDEYIEYKVEKYRKKRIELMKNDDFSVVRTKDYIKNECKLNYDSICSVPELYAEYKEKTIDWLVGEEKKRLENTKGIISFPYEVLSFHSFICYPEAYITIKQIIEKRNIPIVNQNGSINSDYIYLLRMNDPDVQKAYNKIIQNFVKTNGYAYEPNVILNNLEMLPNAYGIEKLIELYQVKIKYIPMSDGSEVRFDNEILRMLLFLLQYYKIEMNEDINIEKSSKEIIETANTLVEKLKEKEKYWMDNMPFNKNN